MTRLLFAVTLAFLTSLVACASVDDISKRHWISGGNVSYGARTHLVKRGDTLYEISRRYGVKVSDLKRLNGITNPRDMPVGMRLKIPTGGRSVASGSSTRPRSSGGGYDAPVNSSVRFAWPLKRVDISSRYGIRGNKKHDGVDLRAPRGTAVYAAAAGEVIFSGWGPSGYGNLVIIKHDPVYISVYAHNAKNYVRKGVKVKKGEKIASVGKTGRASGTHLHFEIRKRRKPVDPLGYLPRR